MKIKSCTAPGCNFPRWGGGYCSRHQGLRKDTFPKAMKRAEIKRVSDLKPVSAKLLNELSRYRALRKRFLVDNPQCAVYPHLPATEIHHKKGRGKYLNDTTTWLAVSRQGHNRIEAFPVEAKEKGWSVSRLSICERCGNVEAGKSKCSYCLNQLSESNEN